MTKLTKMTKMKEGKKDQKTKKEKKTENGNLQYFLKEALSFLGKKLRREEWFLQSNLANITELKLYRRKNIPTKSFVVAVEYN